jgi:hypothetical protein
MATVCGVRSKRPAAVREASFPWSSLLEDAISIYDASPVHAGCWQVARVRTSKQFLQLLLLTNVSGSSVPNMSFRRLRSRDLVIFHRCAQVLCLRDVVEGWMETNEERKNLMVACGCRKMPNAKTSEAWNVLPQAYFIVTPISVADVSHCTMTCFRHYHCILHGICEVGTRFRVVGRCSSRYQETLSSILNETSLDT